MKHTVSDFPCLDIYGNVHALLKHVRAQFVNLPSYISLKLQKGGTHY
jgi:hypothetical protein